MKHGFEHVNKGEKDKEPEPNLSHMDTKGILLASQVIRKQLIEQGMVTGNIPKLDNFNVDPQTTKVSFHVWEKQICPLKVIIPKQQ